MISQSRFGTISYYLYDGLGSTIALIDSTGNITDKYTYEAFGNLINKVGTTVNDYLFAGEQYDPNIGFYYLRARYMDTKTGRFLTQDTYEGDNYDPMTLHKYLYCGNDPINRIDPSGNYSVMEAMAVATIAANLVSTALPIATGMYLCGKNGVSYFAFIKAFRDPSVRQEIATNLGIVVGMAGASSLGGMLFKKFGSKKIVESTCDFLPYVGFGLSILNLCQSINLTKQMLEENIPATDVARTIAVMTGTAALSCAMFNVCFTEDTIVFTQNGNKYINEIEIGNEVYSANPLTKEKGLKRVTQIFVNETDVLVHIYVAAQEIKVTPSHPFWIVGKGWVNAESIVGGDKLQEFSGVVEEVTSVKIVKLKEKIKVYNFEVEDWHTYFVTHLAILVHNACAISPSTKGLRIINKGSANKIFRPKNPALAKKYPGGVKFTGEGFPDFEPYAIEKVTIKYTGSRNGDFTAANAVVGKPKPAGYTWHHVEDTETMLLVPTDLHKAVRHTGGVKVYELLHNIIYGM